MSRYLDGLRYIQNIQYIDSMYNVTILFVINYRLINWYALPIIYISRFHAPTKNILWPPFAPIKDSLHHQPFRWQVARETLQVLPELPPRSLAGLSHGAKTRFPEKNRQKLTETEWKNLEFNKLIDIVIYIYMNIYTYIIYGHRCWKMNVSFGRRWLVLVVANVSLRGA